MRKAYLLLAVMLLCAATAVAQRVSHEFHNVTMPVALQQLGNMTHRYAINFIYNDLEDFRVTTSVKDETVPEAIQHIIGFYPLSMTMVNDSIINVECTQKTILRYKGRVVNEKGDPVGYANVILLSPDDSTFLAGGVSNESGYVVIPCNVRRVIARVSYVGYKTKWFISTSPDLGTIRLQTDRIMLRQVNVTRLRPTITYKGDRTVVDIRHSVLGIGNSAESLLDQLPGVWRNGSNLSIGGIPGVQVMVNDRQIKLSGEQLMNYLKTIRSEEIDKIEIIANPSAEFAAEGTGGILRILTRQRETGSELIAGGNLDFPSYLAAEPYVQYSYNKGKFGFDVSGSGTVGRGCLLVDEYSDNRKDNVDYTSEITDKMNDLNGDISANLYYDFTAYNKLSANLHYYHYGKDEHNVGDTRIGGENAPEIRLTNNHHITQQNYDMLDGSVNFRRNFGVAHQHTLLL